MHNAAMGVLVLGGTGFVGRHVVAALLQRGHAVSTLARGTSPDPLSAAVERLHGDRDAGPAGLAALGGRSWDACIDISAYTPQQLKPSLAQLAGRVGRYVFVSAVSVYREPAPRPVTETAPRLAPADAAVSVVDASSYGALKVACENLVWQHLGARATVLRPQVIVGPHDPSGRLSFWLHRASLAAQMLAPGDGSDHLQFIDVRDVARFAVLLVEHGRAGAFNLAGPRLTWASFIDLIGAVQPVWVAAELLQAAGLGFVELPLFRRDRGPRSALMDVSNAAACAAGLTLTDVAASVRDARAANGDAPLAAGTLSAAAEAELIRRARQRAG